MKKHQYLLGYIITLIVVIFVFMFRQSEYDSVIWNFKIGFGTVAYCGLVIFTLYALVKQKDPVWLLAFVFTASCSYFLLKYSSMVYLYTGPLREIWPFVFLVIVITFLWSGLYLIKHEEKFLQIFGDLFLTATIIFLMLFLGNYFLPKPVQHLGFQEIVGFLVLCTIALGTTVESHALFTNGSTGAAQWIPSILFRVMTVVALGICLLWMNNVFYSGCYPLVAIGKECPCGIVQDSAIGGSISTLKDTVDDFSNQNPDIADVDDPYDPVVTVIVPVELLRGGSLCGTLGMTESEALQFAIKNGMKYFYKKGKLIVLVYPGDRFEKIAGHWVKY